MNIYNTDYTASTCKIYKLYFINQYKKILFNT